VVIASSNRYLVDPITKFIGRLSPTGSDVTILRPSILDGGLLPVDAFVGRNRDAVCVACESEDELAETVERLEQKSIALDFWLMLLDPEISDGTKHRIAIDLEQLFQDDLVYAHVQDIVYSAPLPPAATLRFVSEQASGFHIREFSRELSNAQPRIRTLYGIWTGMKSDPLVASKGHRELTGHFVAKSVFRKIVIVGKTQADVERLIGEITFSLAKVCDPRVVGNVLSEYKRDLPPGDRRKHEAITVANEWQDRDGKAIDLVRKPTRKPHGLYQQAEKEVAAIAGLYAEGKDVQAADFLAQLVARQSTDGGEFVVKSLCNIASRVSTAGRREVSFDLLQQAMKRSDGLDTILYLQIGNEFRDIREFDRALECYQLAKTLDDGSKADGIRDEIIRVYVAKGDYELALSKYQEIEGISQSPRTLTGLGTLYRKMGNLRNARECYWSVLHACEGFNDVADAGLAESSKQSGNLHRAISQYQSIFDRYKDQLDPSSERVYRLALSQLFRLAQQYLRAESELRKLSKAYPLDRSVNLQLAKICVLTGRIDEADDYVMRAKVPDLSEIAAELFRLVMSKSQQFHPHRKYAGLQTKVSLTDYLPEDRGLAGCRNAMAAIIEHDFEAALESLEGVRYVDRIHSDFASVLRFHAKRAMDGRYDYRENPSLCRILKRGFKPIRSMAHSLVGNSFNNAIQQELHFCLLVA
jgi:tetratricopeptide (TPR) repeat protein